MRAQKDLWLIGDTFIDSIYYILQDMKVQAKDGKRPMPYIYEYYNISCWNANQLSPIKNTLARILNSIIDAMNDENNKTRMSRYIVIIPNRDILKFINFQFGISQVIGNCLNWLLTNIIHEVEARKDLMHRKKPGSLSASEPKFMWVKMLHRPNKHSQLLAVHSKFNTILEELLVNRKNHYIIDVTKEVSHPINFSQNNNINERGMECFWEAIDRNIELFDYRKTELTPMMSKPQSKQAGVIKPAPRHI